MEAHHRRRQDEGDLSTTADLSHLEVVAAVVCQFQALDLGLSARLWVVVAEKRSNMTVCTYLFLLAVAVLAASFLLRLVAALF